jgi:hypothetical protein
MKYFWQIYYLFLPEPKLKSDATIKWCRTKGKPYNKVALNKLRNQEMKSHNMFDDDDGDL